MSAADFNPRAAALYHAGEAVTIAHNRLAMTLAEATNAIVCGLIYVGDAIRASAPVRGDE